MSHGSAPLSPIVLYDASGNPLAVQNGVAIPANTSGILAMGTDGTDARQLLCDSSGRQIIIGQGVAGTPAGGVVSVQGVSSGTPQPVSGTVSISGTVPVSGTVTSNQGTPNIIANSWPTELTDGTHGPAAVKAASTAAIATDQALVVAISPNNSVAITAASLPLPSGAATSANQTNGTQQTQIVEGGNIATVTSSSALKVDGSAVTQPVSAASLPLPTGAATASNQITLGAQTTEINDGTRTATIKAASTASVAADTSLVVALSPNSPVPTGSNVIGALSANQSINLNQVGGTAVVTGGVVGSQGVGGLGTAGTPTGGVVSVQGVSGGTAQPISAASLPLPTGAATSANQTTIGTQTTELNDGTRSATIKAASTASVTADTSLVVALSPNSPVPAGTNAIGTVAQGAPSTLANAWPHEITDGTHGPAAVKASSTAPAATDPALVVVISPNQQPFSVTTTPTTSTPGISPGYITTTAKTNVPVRATTYTEQSTNFTGSISSSSTNDSSAGTGARTVTIYYVDQTGATAGSETVTLNGTTAVNLSITTKCFIEKMVVATVGSGGSNAGTITLYTGSAGMAGTVVGSIAIGDNKTFWAHHYVVTGKTCNVTDMTGSNNSTTVQSTFSIQAVSIPVAGLPSLQVSDWIVADNTFQLQRTYSSVIKVAGPARLVLFVAPNGVTSVESMGSFDYYDQ